MIQNKAQKERVIEWHLRHFSTYQVGIVNCQKQLDYIMPSLVSGYSQMGNDSLFYVGNNTERVAIDRIESKRALDLREQIAKNQIIIESIKRAFEELNEQEQNFVKLRYFENKSIQKVKEIMSYSDEKSLYRIRKKVLDRFSISLNNLLSLQ